MAFGLNGLKRNLIGHNEQLIEKDVEYVPNPDFDSSDSDLTLPPTETSDESEYDAAPNEENILPETLIGNSNKENFDVNIKRAETQRLLYEISVLIQTAAYTKLDETIRSLKAIHAVLNASCE